MNILASSDQLRLESLYLSGELMKEKGYRAALDALVADKVKEEREANACIADAYARSAAPIENSHLVVNRIGYAIRGRG